jgi:hypothetical protein
MGILPAMRLLAFLFIASMACAQIGPVPPPPLVSSKKVSAAGGSSSLLTSLVAYWKLDEASGTRNDSVGANHLTDNNTVMSTTGKVGDAADLVRANSESLSIADNAALSVGDIDFTVGAWVKFNLNGASFPSTFHLVSKTGGSADEYWLESDGYNFRFRVYAGGNLYSATEAITVVSGTWYYLVGWHDATANTVNLIVNNGTPTSTSTTGAVPDNSNSSFNIGRYGSGVFYDDGQVDEVGLWKRLLTSDERTELYNSGNGKTYPFN